MARVAKRRRSGARSLLQIGSDQRIMRQNKEVSEIHGRSGCHTVGGFGSSFYVVTCSVIYE
jgi:hypothetical protein